MKPNSLIFLLFLAFSFVNFIGTLNNEFVYDDVALIRDNPFIHDISNLGEHLFDNGYFEVAQAGAYRPVAVLSYYLFYSFSGKNPWPYHLLSIFLHAVNAFLLFLFLLKISGNRNLSFSAAILFICYPAICEAVILITYNEDLFCLMFFLLSMLLYISGRNFLIFFSYATFILALFSKEMAVTLPIIIILYDFLLNNKFQAYRFKEKIREILKIRSVYYLGYLLITFLYIYVLFIYKPISSPKIESAETASGLLHRLIYIPYQYFQFLKISVFPVVLNADRIHTYPESFFTLENIFSVIVFILMVYLVIRFYKKDKLISFGILWFLITLLPIINIISHSHPIAERYLYMSSFGFLLILSWVIINIVPEIRFSDRFKFLNSRFVLIFLILVLYSIRTISRTNDWQNSEILWSKTLALSPDSYRAYNNLGLSYYGNKEFEKAVSAFEDALEVTKSRSEIYANLGNAYFAQQKVKPAIENYRKAIELDPGLIKIHYNLGTAYAIQGDLNQAISQWQIVLELDPQNRGALENIQKARQRMRR